MAVFRIEKNKNYTVMSNHHLRNKNLTLKAKGLLSLILSLPENWDYTIKGLAKICKEGVDSISATVRELEDNGYIVRQRIRNSKGQLKTVEYTILEQPKTAEPEQEKPKRENPVLDKPEQDEPEQVNTAQLNTYKSNTKELNTDCIKYQSINNGAVSDFAETKNSAQRQKKWIDRYNKTISEIKEQIDYDSLIYTNDAEIVNNIVNVMAEVMLIDVPYYTIEGKQYPAELVRINYRQITYGKLEAFLIEYGKIYRKIGNTKAYLITALYNIPLTADAALSNRVKSDMYGGR